MECCDCFTLLVCSSSFSFFTAFTLLLICSVFPLLWKDYHIFHLCLHASSCSSQSCKFCSFFTADYFTLPCLGSHTIIPPASWHFSFLQALSCPLSMEYLEVVQFMSAISSSLVSYWTHIFNSSSSSVPYILSPHSSFNPVMAPLFESTMRLYSAHFYLVSCENYAYPFYKLFHYYTASAHEREQFVLKMNPNPSGNFIHTILFNPYTL